MKNWDEPNSGLKSSCFISVHRILIFIRTSLLEESMGKSGRGDKEITLNNLIMSKYKTITEDIETVTNKEVVKQNRDFSGGFRNL